MLDYHFWKWIGTVGFVIKKLQPAQDGYYRDGYVDRDGIRYPWAFMVDPSVKGSKESGIRWAKNNYYSRNLPDEEVFDYVETDNDHFKLRICEAADGSSQGGKLSFWTCILEKEGIPPFTIGINADLLAELILDSTFENGKCVQEVTLARKNGQIGALHEGMRAYDDMISDLNKKRAVESAEKTSKWEPGYVYQSMTKKGLCIGKLPQIATMETHYTTYYCEFHYTLDFKADKKPLYVEFSSEDDLTTNEKVALELSNPYRRGLPFSDRYPSRMKGEKLLTINLQEIANKMFDEILARKAGSSNLFMEYVPSKVLSFWEVCPDKCIEIMEEMTRRCKNDRKIIKEGIDRNNYKDLCFFSDSQKSRIERDPNYSFRNLRSGLDYLSIKEDYTLNGRKMDLTDVYKEILFQMKKEREKTISLENEKEDEYER